MALLQQTVPERRSSTPAAMPSDPSALWPSTIAAMRSAQSAWARSSWRTRLSILRRFRAIMAERTETVTSAISATLARNAADTLAAEVLPLLDACRYLEQEAESILRPIKFGSRRRPMWLRGIQTETHREPLGVVLLLGPGNYPLFLAGVQALQALAAGNAVIWKPGAGGAAVARIMRQCLLDAGLHADLLHVTDESVAQVPEIIAAGVDKVFLTGSFSTGQAVLRLLAETTTSAVMELSGCDAVFVLEGADLDRLVQALIFGLRINGSATCMAPRRVFVIVSLAQALEERLLKECASLDSVPVSAASRSVLSELIDEARYHGARIVVDGLGDVNSASTNVGFTLICDASPNMLAMKTDIFAPMLTVMPVGDVNDALTAYEACPYALTASIFGPQRPAQELAHRIHAGTVTVNDLIVPTVDPRASFGGRKRSGFGVTRGREGLLEMTAPKTILVRTNRDTRAYEPTTVVHQEMFSGLIQWLHGGSWKMRWRGLQQVVRAAMRLKK